jgi:hypothetical protein
MYIYGISRDDLLRVMTIKLKEYEKKMMDLKTRRLGRTPIYFKLSWKAFPTSTNSITYEFSAAKFYQEYKRQIVDSGIIDTADSISFTIYHSKEEWDSMEVITKNGFYDDINNIAHQIEDNLPTTNVRDKDTIATIYHAADIVVSIHNEYYISHNTDDDEEE